MLRAPRPRDLTRQARVLFKGQTVDGVLAVVTERLGRPAPTEWIYDWGMAVAAGFAKNSREVGGVRACVLEAMPPPRRPALQSRRSRRPRASAARSR